MQDRKHQKRKLERLKEKRCDLSVFSQPLLDEVSSLFRVMMRLISTMVPTRMTLFVWLNWLGVARREMQQLMLIYNWGLVTDWKFLLSVWAGSLNGA